MRLQQLHSFNTHIQLDLSQAMQAMVMFSMLRAFRGQYLMHSEMCALVGM